MTNIELVYNTMKDIRGKTPALLIGGASILFKRLYQGNIYHLANTEDVKNFIAEFYKVDLEKPIVIEDISLLYRDSMLLKFIEESKTPLILLATEDVSEPLQSRVKTILKFPIDTEFGCTFTPILEANNYINENELVGKELEKYIAENCPNIAYLKDLDLRRNKDKIIQILGGLI